jgi:hypothetical protein
MTHLRRGALLLFLALLGSRPAVAARAAPREIPFEVSPRFAAFLSFGSSVAALAGGGFATVWLDSGNGGQSGRIRLQWVQADGTLRLGKDGLAISARGTRAAYPTLVAAPQGGFFVAYTRSTDPGDDRIVVQAFDADGSPRWPGEGSAPFPGGRRERQSQADLLPAADGGVFVCATRQPLQGPGLESKIGCQRLSGRGRRLWGSAGRVAGGRTGWKVLPHVIAGGAGGVGGMLTFWRNQGDPYTNPPVDTILVEGQSFSPTGTPLWGAAGRTIADTRLPESAAAGRDFAVSDGGGGALLLFGAWTQGDAPSPGVVAQRVRSDGQRLWGAGGVPLTGGAEAEYTGALIAAPDGGAFAAIVAHRSDQDFNLLVFRLDGAGNPLWPAAGTPLLDGGGVAEESGARLLFDGERLLAAWNHQSEHPDLRSDIRLALFAADGARLTAPEGEILAPARGYQELAGLAFDPVAASYLAIWNSITRGSESHYDAYGTLFTAGDLP